MRAMRRRGGFTLIELLAVMAIIAIMATMLFPQIGKFQERSQSIVCMNNLRQIGIGVLSFVGDNNNEYPVIEPDPQNPVYTSANDTTDPNAIVAKPMLDVLGPYGVTDAVLKCPADIKGPNWYAANDPHTSYQWRVMLDSENAAAPKFYGGRRGYTVRIVKPSRVTICTDYETVHSGKLNRLYADGHVSRPY
jgi:prepilin-type N-terminal cleavage/methylation domain-containing protein/prepilin-type processing-associated H-X9-DG protein